MGHRLLERRSAQLRPIMASCRSIKLLTRQQIPTDLWSVASANKAVFTGNRLVLIPAVAATNFTDQCVRQKRETFPEVDEAVNTGSVSDLVMEVSVVKSQV